MTISPVGGFCQGQGDFTFITNVVQANLLAATAPQAVGHAMNIGCGEQISLNSVLNIAGELPG